MMQHVQCGWWRLQRRGRGAPGPDRLGGSPRPKSTTSYRKLGTAIQYPMASSCRSTAEAIR